MAYNILKGNVEGSVDIHADQEIGGVKVFKNTISASVFYDTDAQSPCATLKDVAIKKIKGNLNNGLMICDKESGARTHHNLTYNPDKQLLNVENVVSKTVEASGIYLYDLPTDRFIDKINADFLNHGIGLQNVRGNLQLKTTNGLRLDDDGVGINIAPNCGLNITSNRLTVDLSKLQPVNKEGQNIADNDLILLSDVSRGTVTSTTMANLYTSYIKLKVPHAAGAIGQVQFKGKTGFQSTPNLVYDQKQNALDMDGKIKSTTLISKSKLLCEGSVFHNITKVTEKKYNVLPSDYTIVCDTSENDINVKLPPAQNNTGRLVIVKKFNADRFKITSNKILVTSDEGKIDITDTNEIKMNYSSRTFQSDGENWMIIGTKGT